MISSRRTRRIHGAILRALGLGLCALCDTCRFLIVAALAAFLTATSARAHSAPGSAVALDFRFSSVDAELHLPLSELEIAFGSPLAAAPALILPRHRTALFAYVLRHIAVHAPDGRAWHIAADAARVALDDHSADLVVQLRLTPPADAPLRRFTLTYDVISHEVMNHIVTASVRRDPRNPPPGGEPELIGVMRSFLKELPVERLAVSASRAPWLVAALALLAVVALAWPRARAHSEISP